MLSWLRIQNLALIDELTLEFPKGLIILTGETGAGKSVVLGALQLLLGQRADRSLIRSGADSCVVEGIFELPAPPDPLRRLLEERGIDFGEEHQLLIKRVVSSSGTNRQFINNSPVTLSLLQQIGEWLVDLHGPHDHQSLLRPAAQLELLDAYGQLSSLRNEVESLYRKQVDLKRRIEALETDERSIAQQIDLLRFQIQEIESAGFKPGDDEELHEQFRRVTNATRLAELVGEGLALLADGEPSALSQLHRLGRILTELTRLDPSAEGLTTLHETIVSTAGELERELRAYAERLQFDPELARHIEQRMHLLQQLKRKYGPTVEAILEHASKAREQLKRLEHRDAELAQLKELLERTTAQFEERAQELSAQRRRVAGQLADKVTRELQELGFRQCTIEFRLSRSTKPGPSGIDELEILFSPNPGEALRPLRAIASSGEIARVMLAIKTVLAEVDQVPILVFDEVDANVGGETARVVGRKMRAIASRHQVFCVTHLPAVAASASCHFRVWKELRRGRTLTRVAKLEPQERIEELMRMLGGRSDESEALARHLLEVLSDTPTE